MKIKITIVAVLLAIITSACSSSDDGPVNPANNEGNASQDPPTPELVSIPDPAFEQALIDLNIDTQLNGTVPKSSVENVTDLVINDKGITNLTGIEEFDSLINLWANDNQLSSLNVNGLSQLKFIFAERNQIGSLNVAGLAQLEKVGMDGNRLTAINVDGNTNLQILSVPGNQLDAIRVAANSQLNVFSVVDNPLTCIEVSLAQLNNIPEGWEKDDEDQYALNCN